MRGMTSYARAQRSGPDFNLEITLRSTNAKYLEIFTHQLPPEKIFLEEVIKKEIKKKISRGRIEIYFSFHSQPKQKLVIDKELLFQYYSQAKTISRKLGLSQEKIIRNPLLLPGVICLRQQKAIENNQILSALKEGLSRLISFKKKEGLLIRKEIIGNLRQIKQNIQEIKSEKLPSGSEKENSKDIAEEISLISFYITKLEKLIFPKNKNTISKGKAIDFLTQEILRELNAASSKTKIRKRSWGLVEAKRYLERIREQAQNIE